MNRPAPLLVAFCVLASCGLATASSDTPVDRITIRGDARDAGIDRNGADDLSSSVLRVGTAGDNLRGHAAVFFFALPPVPSRDSIVGAELELQYLGTAKGSARNFVTPTFNADLFGLDARAEAAVTATDYHDGPAQPRTGSLIARGVITPKTQPGRVRVADAALRDHVASLYQPDGKPMSAYAAFRMNADATLPTSRSHYQGYEIASADNTDANGEYAPQLKLTVVRKQDGPPTPAAPEPTGAPDSAGLRVWVWVLGILLAICLAVIAVLIRDRLRLGRLAR